MTTLSALRISASEIPPGSSTPRGLLVLLHGWGSNANDLAGLVPDLHLPWLECLCPNAPLAHPQVPDGRMWYDLQTGSGFSEGRQALGQWLTSLPEQTGISVTNTVLAGFSQGGAMTLEVGLELPLAGLMVLSGYLHPTPLPALESPPPVLLIHGQQDPVVPLAAAQQAQQRLMAASVVVEYHEFAMGHEIQPAVIDLSREFLTRVMA